MRKQLAMGAGLALAVGAVALGCSSSKSSGGGFFTLSSVDLNNGDNAPMSSIASNNLSADGAGFSGSNQNFQALTMKVNKKPSNTDGPATSADGSAIIAFQTKDELDGHFRLYMSYFDGSAFTPPIEVTGQDRDEYAAGPDITTNNILMIPLNTSGYKGATNSTTGDAGAVRGNSGNWIVVWDATTYTVAPNAKLPINPLTVSGSPTSTGQNALNAALGPAIQNAGSFNSTNLSTLLLDMRIAQKLQGAHRALFETVFLKSLHSTPSAFSQALGTNSATTTSTTSTAASREYRYGFLVDAVQIGNLTFNRGQEFGFSSNALGTPGSAPGPSDIVSPAESVTSYGFASDGLSGCATFTGTASPFAVGAGGAVNTSAGGIKNVNEFADQPHALLALSGHNPTGAVSGQGNVTANPVAGAPSSASYTVGEDVTFVQLYFTQIVSSANSGDSTGAATPILLQRDQNVHVGNRLAAYRMGLDLRTMQFDAVPTELTMGSTSTEPSGQPLKAAQSPTVNFHTYNQFAFFNFIDASIAHTDAGTALSNGSALAGQVSQNAAVREFNTALLVFTATDSTNGVSTVAAPTRLMTVASSSLKPDNLDVDGFGNASTRSTETFGNQDQAGLDFNGGCPIFGGDEGLGDTTVFFLEQHSSAGATADTNVDTELCAAVLKADGTLQTPGKNPLVLSQSGGENTDTHNAHSNVDQQIGNPNQGNLVTDFQVTAAPVAGTVFQDPVEGAEYCINRAGTYVIVTYRQWQGTSSGSFQKGLMACVMKTLRAASSNGVNALGTVTPAPNATDTRFAVAPSGATATGTMPAGVNTAIRIDLNGQSGTGISSNLGTPTTPGTTVDTQLSSGALNMEYVPNNKMLGLSVPPRFPSAMGVNSALTYPCGYRCSFQSDASISNIMWEQSDTSEDKVFVRQVKVDVTQTTPVVTLGSSVGELESANQVTGDAVIVLDQFGSFNTVVRTKYDFVEGDMANLNNVAVGDLGADATGKGGGLLIVYAKTTDATNSDNNGYNRDVIAVQWDGATLSNRTVIDRGINENALGLTGTNPVAGSQSQSPAVNSFSLQYGSYVSPQPFPIANYGLGPTSVPASGQAAGSPNSGLNTNLAGFVQLAANPDITSKPALSPTETAIFFTTPTGDDGNSSIGLYTRTFNHQLRATNNNTTSFGDSFVPTVGTGPGAATFVQPQRLDHMTGGNVAKAGLTLNVAGTEVTALFKQDGHIWLSGSNDPLTQPYTNDGKGSADPFLVDNDSSASVKSFGEVGYTDSACNNLHKTLVWFVKNDLSATNPTGFYALRLRLRVFN